MAFTYSKIAETAVGSGGSTGIIFSNIPQNYTDLVLKCSLRTDRTAAAQDGLLIKFNGSTVSYADKYLQGAGSGSPVSGSSPFGTTRIYAGEMDTNAATASTFASFDIYIPSYAGSSNKCLSAESVMEQNATTAYATLITGLWSNTTAISNIELTFSNSSNFLQYSTAYLYGVKAEV